MADKQTQQPKEQMEVADASNTGSSGLNYRQIELIGSSVMELLMFAGSIGESANLLSQDHVDTPYAASTTVFTHLIFSTMVFSFCCGFKKTKLLIEEMEQPPSKMQAVSGAWKKFFVLRVILSYFPICLINIVRLSKHSSNLTAWQYVYTIGTVIINGFYVCLVARDIYQWLNKKNDGTRAADGSVTEVKQDSCCSCCC